MSKFTNNIAKECENSPGMLMVISFMVIIMAILNFTGVFDALIILAFSGILYSNYKDYKRKY